MSRRLLQLLTALVGLATVGLGGTQLFLGTLSPMYASLDLPASPLLDSNLRFFGGMGLGLGLIIILVTPRIEVHGQLFAAAWLCAFLGGLGRALSWLQLGTPPAHFVAFTILEVVGAPLFVAWQRRVAEVALDERVSAPSKGT